MTLPWFLVAVSSNPVASSEYHDSTNTNGIGDGSVIVLPGIGSAYMSMHTDAQQHRRCRWLVLLLSCKAARYSSCLHAQVHGMVLLRYYASGDA